jgi:cytidine deaminase
MKQKVMEYKVLEIKYAEYKSLEELSQEDAYLVAKAREVSINAWAPYSKFLVGAAVELANGKIVTGNNQENSAYPSGLCAERVALFSANANFPNSAVTSIAISASNSKGLVHEPIKPCGGCRQALLEAETRFEKPIRIILDGKNSILILEGMNNLLPLNFNGSAL